VKDNQKAFEEVKKDLSTGIYYEDLNNGYCRQILFDAVDLQSVRTPDQLPMDKARYMTIRKMSDSGSYSSVTKLFIKPSIPFEVEFNGAKHKITVLTLMHPSPIRMENVQHDAMLTLGDPGEGNNDGLVVLVPLQGALVAGDSGQFISKITRYLTGVLQPDPATGDYKSMDIPTGNDWALSKMFTGSPGPDGNTVVTQPGYYVWSGYPPLELQLVRTDPVPDSLWSQFFGITYYMRQPDNAYYEWKPAAKQAIQYVMMSQPSLVSSFDLQTIRMLPVTPTTEAVAPIMKWTLSYRRAGKPGANGEWESSCPVPPSTGGAITDLFSSNRREGMENPDKCDPFAGMGSPPDSTEAFVKVVIGFFTVVSVGLAIYLAVLFFTKTKWGRWMANQGTIAGNKVAQAFVSDSREIIPVNPLFDTQLAEAEDKAKAAEEERKAAAEEQRIAKEKAREGAERMAKEKAASRGVRSGPVAAEEAKTPEGAAAIAEAGKEAEAAVPPHKRGGPDRMAAIEAKKAEAVAVAKAAKEAEAEVKRKEDEAAAKAADAAMGEAAEARLAAPRSVVNPMRARNPAAGTGLFTPAEEKVVAAVGEEAKKEDEAIDENKKALEKAERLREKLKKIQEEKDAAQKAADEAKAAFAAAVAAKREKNEERAATEAKDDAAISASTAANKPKPKVYRGPAVPPPPLASLRTQQKKAEAEVKAAETQLADAEAEQKKNEEIAKAAEEAAKSASKAAEKQVANLATPLKRRIVTSDRDLLVAKQTTVKPSTGETKTVEDPKKVVNAYAEAIQTYKDSRNPEDYKAARKLEPDARAVSLNSPTLKTRYQELVQDLVRLHEDSSAPSEKSPKELLDRLVTLEANVKTEKNKVLFSKSGPIAQDTNETRLAKALDLLANRLTYTNAQLNKMNAAPLDRSAVETKVNQLSKLVLAERAAQAERRKGMDGKGRRRRKMKRKSTRRYVA
jgi:hypothetical protein